VTEVGDSYFAAAVEHDVRGLQIAMKDPAIVCRGETSAHLPNDLDRLIGREPPDPPQQ
jgi:hypothetical protein